MTTTLITNEKNVSHTEITEKIKELNDETINFVINVNNMVGNLGSEKLQNAINAISKALFVLQKDNINRNIVNITIIVNKILQPQIRLNRSEIICILYYLQQNIGTIQMEMDSNEMPTWSIQEEVFEKLKNE